MCEFKICTFDVIFIFIYNHKREEGLYMKDIRTYVFEDLSEDKFQKYLVSTKEYKIISEKIQKEEEKLQQILIQSMPFYEARKIIEKLSAYYFEYTTVLSQLEFRFAFLNGIYLGMNAKAEIDTNFINEVENIFND